MGSDWNHLSLNGLAVRSYSGSDANDGAVALYGARSVDPIQDVGVVHMMYTGSSGGYSTHGLTKIIDSAGVEVPYSRFEGQPRYKVSKGQVVTVQFTYENNGATTQIPNVGLYFSGDSTISTSVTTTSVR